MMEDLYKLEQKRVTRLVKFHLKLKQANEAQIQTRVEREEKLKAKLKAREEKLAIAEQLREERSTQLQEIIKARFQVRNEIVAMHEFEYARKKQVWITRQVTDELRSEQFREKQSLSRSQKSELWAKKYNEILTRVEEKEQDVQRKNKQLLESLHVRSAIVSERKQEEMLRRQLQGENENLRVLDAIEKKRRNEILDAQKRTQIAALIHEEDKKVHAIKTTKNQLFQQRKRVADNHHIHQMSTLIASKDTASPGPADYPNPISAIDPTTGATISDAPKDDDLRQIPGTIDYQVFHAKSLPPIGAYDLQILPDGSRPWEQQPVLTWSTSKKMSYIDQEISGEDRLPGPASYETTVSAITDHGVKIPREYIPKSDIRNREWVTGNSDASIPGPTTYTVDTFTREQILVPVQVPNYTPMLRSVIKDTRKLHEIPPSLNVSELDI